MQQCRLVSDAIERAAFQIRPIGSVLAYGSVIRVVPAADCKAAALFD
jgi:hypothetical protein